MSNAKDRGRAQEILNATGIDFICADIEDGLSLRDMASNLGISVGPLLRWVNADSERLQAYMRARQVASDAYADLAQQVVEDCDGMTDLRVGEHLTQSIRVFDADVLKAQIAKAKELAIQYRWKSGVVDPRRYGSKLELSGKVGLSTASDEELAAREAALAAQIAELEAEQRRAGDIGAGE